MRIQSIEETLLSIANLPAQLHPANLPQPLRQALNGNLTDIPLGSGARYALDGGSNVEVFSGAAGEVYAAVVEMEGVYPLAGSYAQNRGRIELLVALKGEAQVSVNDHIQQLTIGHPVLVGDGDRYSIAGGGRFLVLVLDAADGTTEIIKHK